MQRPERNTLSTLSGTHDDDYTYKHISYISLNGQENTFTKMHYGEHLQQQRTTENTSNNNALRRTHDGNTSNNDALLGRCLLEQSPAQGRAQTGGDDQEMLNQQRGPATQFMEEQGRSNSSRDPAVRSHTPRHHNTRSLERWGDTARPTVLAGRSRCLLKEDHLE